MDEFAQGWRSQPPVVRPGGAAYSHGPSVAEVRSGWQTARPSLALAAAYLARKDVGAAEACPGFAAKLKARGIDYGDAAVARVTHGGGVARPYAGSILTVSLPVISPDGRSALVETGVVCGGLCGTGERALYQKDRAGRWRRVGTAMTWIS